MPEKSSMRICFLALVGASSAVILRHPVFASVLAPPRRRQIVACASAEDERRRLEIKRLEECLKVANLEAAAEEAEANNNLPGVIAAYEELLSLEPPTSPGLREEDAARRALQQLLLESAQRELEACLEVEGCDVGGPAWGSSVPSEFIEEEMRRAPQFIESELRRAQRAGEESRKVLATRALADVKRVRTAVVDLLELTESQAREAAEKAAGEQAESRLLDGDPGWLAGWQKAEAQRRMDDTRLLRKSVEADLNMLELQLLQGDPSLSFLRNVLTATRNDPLPLEATGSLWLQEQFEQGALPRDPELLRTLLRAARDDPEMVVRLVTQAKDGEGKDIYTRRENDKTQFL